MFLESQSFLCLGLALHVKELRSMLLMPGTISWSAMRIWVIDLVDELVALPISSACGSNRPSPVAR
jgi:hypothetical protein